MPRKPVHTLPDVERTDLLAELAALLQATGNPVLSLQKLAAIHPTQARLLRNAERLAEQGVSLDALLLRSGVLRANEAHWLVSYFSSGCAVEGLQELASDLDSKRTALARLRVRLWASSLLAVLVFFIVGLLALMQQGAAAVPHLMWVVGKAVVQLGLVVWLMFWVLTVSRWQWLTLCWRLRLQRLPVAITLFEACWLTSLVRLLRGGQDAAGALAALVKLVNAQPFQHGMARCISAAQRGQSLTESLRSEALPISDATWQLLHVGEQTGALDRALQRRLQDQVAQVIDWQQAAAVWLPRLYYLCVLSVAGGVLASV